jgi:ABC-type multidrug transport system ATPase subunit
MDEATLCDRVALIQHGRILATDTPQAITNAFPWQLFEVKSTDTLNMINLLKQHPEVHNADLFGETVHVSVKPGRISADDLFSYLQEHGHLQSEIIQGNPGIEDCFIDLMRMTNE